VVAGFAVVLGLLTQYPLSTKLGSNCTVVIDDTRLRSKCGHSRHRQREPTRRFRNRTRRPRPLSSSGVIGLGTGFMKPLRVVLAGKRLAHVRRASPTLSLSIRAPR